MSEIREIVNSLEDRFQKLFNKMESMQRTNQEMLLKLGESERIIQKQQQEITSLQTNFDSIKITNSLLGSDEYKRDTKLKINSLIREIDYCIAQLSD
jgi:translation initiation factor 2 alpha subunit (eIF-2alpha)